MPGSPRGTTGGAKTKGTPRKDPRTANGTARRKLRSWLRAQGRPCWICVAFGRSGAIDYSLPARHPLSFEVDELVPVSKGGDPLDRANVDAAHRCCNQWRGNRSVAEVLAIARGGSRSGSPDPRRSEGSGSSRW